MVMVVGNDIVKINDSEWQSRSSRTFLPLAPSSCAYQSIKQMRHTPHTLDSSPLLDSSLPALLTSIMTTSPADGEVLDTIHRLLGSRIRVTMTDGRIASGKFMSLDRLGSIMLEDVVEQRWLAYHDVSTADKKDAKSNDVDNTADASVTNSADNNNVQQHVHHTKDESGLVCQWTTERSLTQAVIIGMKVAKVEIMMREWEARLEKTTE